MERSLMLKVLAGVALATVLPAVAMAADNAELVALMKADQDDRADADLAKNWHELAQRDRERRDRVLEMLKAGTLGTAWDYFNAALVLQHGAEAVDVRLAHSLSTLAATLDPQHPGAKWLMAASWDRLMLRLKQPQWYGTQWTEDSSGIRVLEPVHPTAVSDADRLALGVPTLAEARARLNSRNGSE
jgi:hypothetical protein